MPERREFEELVAAARLRPEYLRDTAFLIPLASLTISNLRLQALWPRWAERDPGLVDQLLDLFRSGADPAPREAAAIALVYVQDARVLAPFIAALANRRDPLGWWAVGTRWASLGTRGPCRPSLRPSPGTREAVEPLIVWLRVVSALSGAVPRKRWGRSAIPARSRPSRRRTMSGHIRGGSWGGCPRTSTRGGCKRQSSPKPVLHPERAQDKIG